MIHQLAQWNWGGIAFVVLWLPACAGAVALLRRWAMRAPAKELQPEPKAPALEFPQPSRSQRCDQAVERAWAAFEKAREEYRAAHPPEQIELAQRVQSRWHGKPMRRPVIFQPPLSDTEIYTILHGRRKQG